jgi:hypothetical protein
MPPRQHPRIWCAISGHGYGHLAQVAPVINRLLEEVPNTRIHVASGLPETIIRDKMPGISSIENQVQDVGLIQRDPFIIEKEPTLNALNRLHDNWEQKVEFEARRIGEFKPDLIIGDIPYRVFSAAHRLQIPSIAIASLSWDRVIKAYFDVSQPPIRGWHQQMIEAYSCATLAILPTPSMGKGPFIETLAIDPIHQAGNCQADKLRRLLDIDRKDKRPIILVTTGGINLSIALSHLSQMNQFHWLLRGVQSHGHNHIHDVGDLQSINFTDVVASIDLVIGKMGYNLTVETAAFGVPFVYITRGDFPDEPPLIDWFSRHGLGTQMALQDFRDGNWSKHIEKMIGKKRDQKMFKGADQATETIQSYL